MYLYCVLWRFFLCCVCLSSSFCVSFFFNDTATTEIYTLSLHDALPIFSVCIPKIAAKKAFLNKGDCAGGTDIVCARSEEHTSELQSQSNLVCRLLLEKKKKKKKK